MIFFEDILRCTTIPDPLHQLKLTQEHALPLQRDIHLFHIHDDKLHSSLLLSSAVRIQLQFTNFRIKVKATTICPQFDDSDLTVKGCYNCPILARIHFKAHSTCESGVVYVQFQDIMIHTKAIHISTEPKEHVIKFFAEKRCYNEKICLKSSTLLQCQTVKFCLEEPSVELLQLNTNYTSVNSLQTTHTWPEWFHLPNFTSSFFMLKYIGSALFIVCIFITMFSTIITCCCRTR